MQQKRRIRYIMSFILLTAGVILFVILNICVGTVEISLSDIFASLQGKTVKNARILWDIRMPRTLAAMILGRPETGGNFSPKMPFGKMPNPPNSK